MFLWSICHNYYNYLKDYQNVVEEVGLENIFHTANTKFNSLISVYVVKCRRV